MCFVVDENLHRRFIWENSSFLEVISSSILDILYSTMKADEIVLPEATVEASDFSVELRRS